MSQAAQKVWDRDAIIELLDKSDQAVARAVLTLYGRQTTEEQATKDTRVRNNRGFNSRDAGFLSDIAQKLPRYGNRMTPRQLLRVRPMVRKYWRQLLEEIELKGQAVSYTVAKASKPAIATPLPEDEILEELEMADDFAAAERAAEARAFAADARSWGMF